MPITTNVTRSELCSDRKYVVTKGEDGFFTLWMEYRLDGTFEPICKRGFLQDAWDKANVLMENDRKHGIVSTLTFDMHTITPTDMPYVWA